MDEQDMKLNWFETRPGFYFIAWEDEDGPGLMLGEGTGKDDDHAAATRAAAAIGQPSTGDGGQLYWHEERDVRKALRAANAALEAYQAGIKLPDWALKAQSEGWKPPKSWKPKQNDDLVKPRPPATPSSMEFNQGYDMDDEE